MRVIRSRFTAVAAIVTILPTASRNVSAPRDSGVVLPHAVTTPPPPAPPLTFDPDAGTGVRSHPLSDFVDDLANKKLIGLPTPMPVEQSSGLPCDLVIYPMTGAVTVAITPSANWYIAALIKNENNCKPKQFGLGNHKTAAWVVSISKWPVDRKRMRLGSARVIVLHKNVLGGDDHVNTSNPVWELWQCGHHTDGDRPDDASMVNVDVCDAADQVGHNAGAMREAITARLNLRKSAGVMTLQASIWDPFDNPTLWFACGADCCYTDITR